MINSLRKDMADTSCHGMIVSSLLNNLPVYKMCYLYPRTSVTHIPGLYNGEGEFDFFSPPTLPPDSISYNSDRESFTSNGLNS